MKTLEECAEEAVKNCVGLKQGERVTIIYDHASVELAGLIGAQIEVLGGFTSVYCMEKYGHRPDNGENPLNLPDVIKNSLKNADVSFLVRRETKKGESKTFTFPMLDCIIENKGLRHVHMPGITEEAFLSGMSVDYNELKKFTSEVYDVVKDAKEIRVTTPAGTDFTAELGKYKWCIADGFPAPGKWVNLPDGETFTTPYDLHGKIVVDGVLGDRFDKNYGLLEKTPLRLDVVSGRIINLQSSNKDLEKEFLEYISTDSNSNRFGEFAIGTNKGLRGLIGNMIHDEKFPGVHVAVGDPIGEETGADWLSDVHCDMVMQKCSIYVDGRQIMSDGRFLI